MPGALAMIWNVIQTLTLFGLCVVVVQVVKLQGRLLIRLDALERDCSRVEAAAAVGLAVGEPIPDFALEDLQGREATAADFRGRRTLLIHWSFLCGYCDQIAADLAQTRERLLALGVHLVLASRDEVATNRERAGEHGLADAILLLGGDSPLAAEAFRHQGTPVGYLLDDQARVARPLAVGSDAILDLVREILSERPGRVRLPNERPLAESRIERNGLKAGTPAPLFRLPDLRGGTVALEDYRGRRVLMIFTDPRCGPCDELAPHLARWHREHGDELALILVSRGDAEEVRRKADRHGFNFPIAMQERWNLSRDYGIFVVPVAFLIGEDGMIIEDVARGVNEILALASRGLAPARV